VNDVTAAPGADQGDASKPDGPLEFKLSKPILSFGKQIDTLTLRKPTGADLIRIGNPVIFTPHVDPPRVEHDMARVIAMVAKLSGVPSTSLETLDPADLVGLAWAISPFFMPA